MKKEHWLPLSIIFLGIAILGSSIQTADQITRIPTGSSSFNVETNNISYSLDRIADNMNKETKSEEERAALYLSEAADYLGLTIGELTYLIEQENVDIPYIKVGPKYVFYKESLDEWTKGIDQHTYIID